MSLKPWYTEWTCCVTQQCLLHYQFEQFYKKHKEPIFYVNECSNCWLELPCLHNQICLRPYRIQVPTSQDTYTVYENNRGDDSVFGQVFPHGYVYLPPGPYHHDRGTELKSELLTCRQQQLELFSWSDDLET